MIKHSNIFVFVALFLILGITANLNAQSRVISVEQGIGSLNDAINSDTTETGERIEPENTVYELERGGYYLTNGIISNNGWPLRIRAAEGEGDRPVIQPAVIEGGESTYPFRPRGDFYISGLYITNMDQDGLLMQRPIRASADSMRIVVDDCHIDYASQAAFRIDNAWNKIYITNSIISNMGRMESPPNGRGVDDRGNDIDTLIMENNTFYNLTFSMIRDGGGIINYCRVNHNTIVNVRMYGIHFGETIEAHFTNNLLINGGFLGGFFDDRPVLSIGALGEDLINEGIQQVVIVDNNNFYINPELIDAQPDTVNVVPLFDSTTAALIEENSTGENNIEEDIQFASGPNLPTDAITSFYDVMIEPENRTDMDDGGGGPRPGEGVPVQLPFDFSYANTYQSYTGGTSGQPIGALSWFGMTVGVDDKISEALPDGFELYQNYPNPFNPSTKITYNIPSNTFVNLKVFDVLGKQVAVLINREQPAGLYEVNFDASNLSSGVYFYRLETGAFVKTYKMLLMR